MKSEIQHAAQCWRLEQVISIVNCDTTVCLSGQIVKFRKDMKLECDSGKDPRLAKEFMARRVQALMGLKVLRAMASKWQSQAMAHVEMPVEENAGLSMIGHAWQRLYLKPANDPAVLARALLAHSEI